MNVTISRRRTGVAAALGLSILLTVGSAAAGWATGGAGLSPSARLHGYSLEDMAEATAPFTRSGNDPARYPDTPFEILHLTEMDFALVGDGLLATGARAFTVPAGTPLFVPVFNVNDDPPVLGTFPTTAADAVPYFFGQSQYGGRDFEVVVDGSSTALGPAYLSGPHPVAGAAGSHIITLGALVAPLSAGVHTVQIRGGIFGDLVDDTYGFAFIQEDFTYTVEVVGQG